MWPHLYCGTQHPVVIFSFRFASSIGLDALERQCIYILTYTSCHWAIQHMIGIQKTREGGRNSGRPRDWKFRDCPISSVIGNGPCLGTRQRTQLTWSLPCLPWEDELGLPLASQSLSTLHTLQLALYVLLRWFVIKNNGYFHSTALFQIFPSAPCLVFFLGYPKRMKISRTGGPKKMHS